MNDSTGNLLTEYAVAGGFGFIIGLIVLIISCIITGTLIDDSLVISILFCFVWAIYFIGWYQYLIVDEREPNDLISGLIAFFLGWLIGFVKAIVRVIRTL